MQLHMRMYKLAQKNKLKSKLKPDASKPESKALTH